MTPLLEDRICYTATATGSYAKAAELAAKWGCPTDDSTMHAVVQRVGQRAQKQEEQRLDRPAVAETGRKAPEALIIMMDGWLVRERGPEWGSPPEQDKTQRVSWHEIKTGVIYRLDQAGKTASGRGLIAEKGVVAYQGEPLEFGRRLQSEAYRLGLGQAKNIYIVADGAVWIWHLQKDRFASAHGLLDFYHASQHLWAIAHDLFADNQEKAQAWVEPLLHQLRHGQSERVLQRLEDLPRWCKNRGQPVPEAVAREQAYFAHHRDHLDYQGMEKKGYPIGSGAVESMCCQLQGRFKRCGQFWTEEGLTRLMSLDLAHRNKHWNALRSQN
jgi:hypothetical protein